MTFKQLLRNPWHIFAKILPYRPLPARRDLFWEDYARSSSRKKVTWIEITPKIMAYFWQFSFCIIIKYSSFYLKTITVSIFTDHWGEIKKKPLTLIISKLRLARRSALSTFLREADDMINTTEWLMTHKQGVLSVPNGWDARKHYYMYIIITSSQSPCLYIIVVVRRRRRKYWKFPIIR